MKVLVTGGAGFIGSHIVEHFQGKHGVRVLDNLRTGTRKNLQGFACEFIEGSITDRGLVRDAVDGVDYVFHLAAMVSVPESVAKPIECVELNTIGTLIVLEEASRAKVKKLCFSSSAAIYGDDPMVPKVESMTPAPRSPYAVTKLDGEYYCEMFRRENRIETVSLRYFNVFGPRQNPRGPYAAAVPIFIERALQDEPITIHGDGSQTRDFIFVRDVVAANVHFARAEGVTGVFNVAAGGRITINDLARKISVVTKSNSAIEYGPKRPGDVDHSTASVEKLRGAGFSAQTTFEEGLAATVKAFSYE